jgi:endoglucanase
MQMRTMFRSRRHWPALALTAALVALLSLVAACGSGSPAGVRPSPTAASRSSTAAGKPAPSGPLYAYREQQLYDTVALLERNRRTGEAAALTAIARTPAALWAAGQRGEMQEVRQATLAGRRAGSIPVIVAYNLPDRDTCGKYSANRGTGGAAYEAWINQLADAIGAGRDIVIVEPDALPDIVRGCLSSARAALRYRLLDYAMSHLSRLPHAYVYLDAGNPGMFADPEVLAGPAVRAGIRYGRGFSGNVSNFQWTAVTVAWSQRLEAALGGNLGAVVDTSRNGNGPYSGPDSPQWCNPPGRAPGPDPRLAPGPAGIDAYLWIKDPGVSDGPCNGGPVAGRYWAAYAEGLAQAASRSGGTT